MSFLGALCCLGVVVPVAMQRRYCGSPDGFFAKREVRDVLLAWMNRGKVSVGHVERLHAHNKMSLSTTQRTRRHAEAAVYHSFLKKWMGAHLRRGRLDFTLSKSETAFARRGGLTVNGDRRRTKVKLAGGGSRLRIRSDKAPRVLRMQSFLLWA